MLRPEGCMDRIVSTDRVDFCSRYRKSCYLVRLGGEIERDIGSGYGYLILMRMDTVSGWVSESRTRNTGRVLFCSLKARAIEPRLKSIFLEPVQNG